MTSSKSMLLDVSREVCRHILIDESVARVIPFLVREVPLQELVIRSIDSKRGSLDTVAVGMLQATPAPASARSQCGPQEMEGILAWCRRGEVERSKRIFSEEALRRTSAHGIDRPVHGGSLGGRG